MRIGDLSLVQNSTKHPQRANFLFENLNFLDENLRFSLRKILMIFSMIFSTIHKFLTTKSEFPRGV